MSAALWCFDIPVLNVTTVREGGFGDPHIRTADGLLFDCQAAGEFVSLTSLETPELMVQQRFTSVSTEECSQASVTTGIAFQDVSVPKVELSIPQNPSSMTPNWIDGCPIDFLIDSAVTLFNQTLPSGILLAQAGSSVGILHLASGFRVEARVRDSDSFGCHFLTSVMIPTDFHEGETLIGLMGTPNGNNTDEWVDSTGSVLPLPVTEDDRFFEAGYDYCTQNWCIDDASESLFSYVHLSESFSTHYACNAPYDSSLQEMIEANNVDPELFDVCEDAAIFCLVDGICGTPIDSANVIDDLDFIQTSMGLACGDPHFKTFNELFFSYHGQCDLVLTRSNSFDSGLGLDVHIRTTRVDNLQADYSYISGAAVKLGNDIFEVSEEGTLIVNGKSTVIPDDSAFISFGGRHNLKRSLKGEKRLIIMYHLDLGGGRSIQIRANTKTGMLFVDTSGVFADSTGLLGTVSKEGNDFLFGRDGVTDLKGHWNTYGEEWQVNDEDPKLFQDSERYPQFPIGCVYEVEREKTHFRRRHLADKASKITFEVASDACSHLEDDPMKDFCVNDIMATGDLDLAEDYSY